jgi:hypothetical protein
VKNPIKLRKKIKKTIEEYIKPVNYSLKCGGCRSELYDLLVKLFYTYFNNEKS